MVFFWLAHGVGALTVNQIMIKDDAGKVRATLGMGPTGNAMLSFMGNEEEAKLVLGSQPNGMPWFFMAGSTSKPILAIIAENNEPAIYLYNDSQPGQPRIGISVMDSRPMLGVFAPDGEPVWNAPQ